MASTVETILANLNGLAFNNPSLTALFKKIAQAVGIPIDATITEFANSENRIMNIIQSQRYGKGGYYTTSAKAFQYGDNLIIDPTTKNYIYATITPTKQIVAQAAFEEIKSGNSSSLFLKIAALDAVSGNLIKLSVPQLAAFINYYVIFELPGLPISIINVDANVLNFKSTCTYFATYDFSALSINLAAALTLFKQTFDFNGEFFAGDLQDYIKSNVPGIRDFYLYNTTIDNSPFGGSQTLNSGYFNYDTTILTSINYAAI